MKQSCGENSDYTNLMSEVSQVFFFFLREQTQIAFQISKLFRRYYSIQKKCYKFSKILIFKKKIQHLNFFNMNNV